MINKLLFITLSNIGDVVLTLPALDRLRQEFPSAKISVICGPRTKDIFENAPFVEKLVIFDKHAPLKEKIKLFKELSRERFDAIIDLRDSLFGLALPAKYKIPLLRRMPANIVHMKDKHLYKVKTKKAKRKSEEAGEAPRESLYIGPEDEVYVKQLLESNNLSRDDKLVVIAPGSRSHTKKWAKEKFAALVASLSKERGVKIILVGDKDDLETARFITENHPGLSAYVNNVSFYCNRMG